MSAASKHSAVVIGASGTLGSALQAILVEEDGYACVHGFSRSQSGPYHIDLTDEASIKAAALLIAKGPAPSLIIIATGAADAAAGDGIESLSAEQLAHSFAVNAIGPALLAKHILPLMPPRTRSVFAVLSARAGSISENWQGGSYALRASKAALNMLVRTLAIEQRRTKDRCIVVGLHPGAVAASSNAPAGTASSQRAALQLLDVIEELKMPDTGKLFDQEGREIAF